MKRRWLTLAIALALLTGLALSAFAQTPPRVVLPRLIFRAQGSPGLYEILPPRFGLEQAAKLLGDLKVVGRSGQAPPTTLAAAPQPVVVFGRSAEAPTAIYSGANGSLSWFPDLSVRGMVPDGGEAKRIASDWVKGNMLTPAEEGGVWEVEDVTTLTRQESGAGAKPEEALRTVRFVRMLDGLPVRGERSVLTAQVGPEGKIVGAVRDFRPIRRSAQAIPMKSREQLDQEMQRRFDVFVAELKKQNPEYEAKLLNSQMIYYEQGGQYLQPAFLGSVLITGPKGIVGGKALLVSALTQTPEPIQERSRPARQTPSGPEKGPRLLGAAPDTGPRVQLADIEITPHIGTMTLAQADIRYGMYVVRDDSWDWVDDAWDFHTNLDAANALRRSTIDSGTKPTVMDQYFWNHVWLFRDGEGQPDYSQQFVRKVDFVIIEGHGAPYLITTRSDCCDVIYLDGIPGYGPNSSLKGRTDYVLWKSCHVIPAPPEDANWPNVWWSMFKGMRGNYGFCQTMWIDDDISDNFGYSIGLGVPNLSAWFSAVDSCKWNHLNGGWEYGSAVIPCGQENECIYDYTGLPNPDCLTIWWQHS